VRGSYGSVIAHGHCSTVPSDLAAYRNRIQSARRLHDRLERVRIEGHMVALPWWLAAERGASARHPLSRCPDLQVALIPGNKKNTGHGRRCSPRGAIHPCAGIIPIRSTVGGGEATLSARLPELPLRRVSIVGSRLLGASGAVKTRGGSAVPTLARMVWVGHGPIPLPGAASVPAGVTRSVTTRAETRSLGISC
jgi:hypothetical protein